MLDCCSPGDSSCIIVQNSLCQKRINKQICTQGLNDIFLHAFSIDIARDVTYGFSLVPTLMHIHKTNFQLSIKGRQV